MRRRRSIVLNLPIYLLSTLLAFGGNQLAEAVFHTEGGNFNFPESPNVKSAHQQAQQPLNEPFYDVELANTDEELQRPPYSEYARPENNLAGIVDELNQMRRQQELYDELNNQFGQDVDGIPVEPASQETVPKPRLGRVADVQQGSTAHELEELRRFGNKFKELTQAKQEQTSDNLPQQEVIEEQPSEVSVEKPTKDHKTTEEEEEKPLSAQKKGQSEFVEFVEPVIAHSKKLKNKEYLEKRIASDDDRHSSRHSKYRAFNFISSSGNVIFVAFVTMCCVFSVVGVVGGIYYYNNIRTSREDPFDDFTRYSPAGPGRDKLKKSGRGANAFGGFEKGDESLAYKAQLHHYQQTKQKIIGEQGAIGGGQCDPDASDKSDDEADLEHNFSVYECPGLAPTGDIEVQNPNFIESPTAQKKSSLK